MGAYYRPEIWKSDGPFGAVMDDFGPSRRRGWTRAGREMLSALPRALEVVWDPIFGESILINVPRIFF